jgi:hypothetical protein
MCGSLLPPFFSNPACTAQCFSTHSTMQRRAASMLMGRARCAAAAAGGRAGAAGGQRRLASAVVDTQSMYAADEAPESHYAVARNPTMGETRSLNGFTATVRNVSVSCAYARARLVAACTHQSAAREAARLSAPLIKRPTHVLIAARQPAVLENPFPVLPSASKVARSRSRARCHSNVRVLSVVVRGVRFSHTHAVLPAWRTCCQQKFASSLSWPAAAVAA